VEQAPLLGREIEVPFAFVVGILEVVMHLCRSRIEARAEILWSCLVFFQRIDKRFGAGIYVRLKGLVV
jgi:hypothetical protein